MSILHRCDIHYVKYLIIASIFLKTFSANAQKWEELNPPPPLFNGAIRASVTDGSGNVYAAGDFKNSSGQYIVARWNGNNWSELGTGSNALQANGAIYAMTRDSNGNLYVAGAFTNVQGTHYVARWNGVTWSVLGSGSSALTINNSIFCLTTDNSGNVYAAGALTDTVDDYSVARWDGIKWTALGAANSQLKANSYVYALASDNAGNVYAAGDFTDADGGHYVAEWNGTHWTQLGVGTAALHANEWINALAVNNAGKVYAAGSFENSASDRYVAEWNGISWKEIGSGAGALKANDVINVLNVDGMGRLYAAGMFSDSAGRLRVARYDGTGWQDAFNVPGGYTISAINAICLDARGNLYSGGSFLDEDGNYYVARYDGRAMTETGRAGNSLNVFNGISKVAAGTHGNVYAIGNFANSYSKPYIAHWNGNTWSELGGDTAHLDFHEITAIACDHKGRLYVCADLVTAIGKPTILLWDGHLWQRLGSPAHPIKVFEPIRQLTTDRSGNLYAAGAFGDSSLFSYNVLKWDGTDYRLYPCPTGDPASLFADTAGNIYIGIALHDQQGKYQVMKINQQGSVQLGQGATALNSGSKISALAMDKKGNLLASSLNNEGWNSISNFVAKWDGSSWSTAGSASGKYGNGYVYDMTTDGSGNVYAASVSNTSYYSVASWNGTDWSELGNGAQALNANSDITTVTTDDAGNVYAAGWFNNTHNFQFVARYGFASGDGTAAFPAPLIYLPDTVLCSNEGMQDAQLLNVPDTNTTTTLATLDGERIPVSTSGIISFNIATLEPGAHVLQAAYQNAGIIKSTSASFQIVPASAPKVSLSASATIVHDQAAPVHISAINAAGGGNHPLFTFSKNMVMTDLLQPESEKNELMIPIGVLTVGSNKIYVRMRTSDICYSKSTDTDSITVVRSSSDILADPDYPDQPIGIAPNPFHNLLQLTGLQSENAYAVLIYNSTGRKVFTQVLEGNTAYEINLAALSSGTYWIQLRDNTKNLILGVRMLIKR